MNSAFSPEGHSPQVSPDSLGLSALDISARIRQVRMPAILLGVLALVTLMAATTIVSLDCTEQGCNPGSNWLSTTLIVFLPFFIAIIGELRLLAAVVTGGDLQAVSSRLLSAQIAVGGASLIFAFLDRGAFV